MLALKFPELKKPVSCAKKMSLWEEWKYIRFHRNLQKVDERMLHEQIKIDGHSEGLAEGRTQGRHEGLTEGHEKGLAEGLEEGRTQGRHEGLTEGMAIEKIEVAKNALAKGLSIEMIHEITGLDIETIRCLNS